MVDVIHTNARHRDGDVLIPYFGTILSLGTIDFYPNYGFGSRRSLGNHALAHELFTWSIKNPGKLETAQKLNKDGSITKLVPAGVKVNACMKTVQKTRAAEMGYFADQRCKQYGNWYASVNPDPPFAPKKIK